MKRFYNLARVFAEHTWDGMLEPLLSKEEMRRRFEADDVSREAWRSLVEEPLGRAIEKYLQDDLVRGVVLTDGKIGVFTHPHDRSLVQNRCFLYHLIGNKTGEWKVPVGGMGAVARELEETARAGGAEMVTNVSLGKIEVGGGKQTVAFSVGGQSDSVQSKFLLVNFGRNVLAQIHRDNFSNPNRLMKASVFKINMLLRRLPKLKAQNVSATEAFCGTFHTDEGYKQMQLSYEQAARGLVPDKPPGEVYCHTLTDDSILSPELRAQGYHTMTLFGLDTPWSLYARDNATMRRETEKKFLASMNQWLEEPLEDCLAVARDGSRCIESKSPVDIEDSLGMYHGNIFQNAPTFPFAPSKEEAGTWGVETEWENVFLCGSSAHRGGAVSGIPGHNAAMKVLKMCLLLLLALMPAAFAQEAIAKTNRSLLQPEMEAQLQPGDMDPSDFLTGDWGGYRQELHRAGIDVFAFYNAIFNGNISGGIHPGHATYVDDAWLGFKFDLEKLVGWKGGLFVVSGINRQGDDLTNLYVGSVYSVQQMVGGQRPFLYQVYLQQKLFDDKVTLKLGRFGASDDFNASPFYGYSLNNGIDGDIRNVLFDTRFSAYPFAVWAAALFYDPSPEFNWKFGFFQTSKEMFNNNDHGLNWRINHEDGYTAILQIGWTPQFWKQPVYDSLGNGKNAPVMKGMPGHYHIGVTFSQWDFYPRFEGGFEDHSYGFYAHADQMVYQEAPGSDQGLVVFLASGYYPQSEISIVPFQINAGLNYKGLFPTRDNDRTMLHFIYGHLSRDYARSVRVPGGDEADSEKVVEVAHRFQPTKWFYFQPDLQWVIDPGGTGDVANAVVIGAEWGAAF